MGICEAARFIKAKSRGGFSRPDKDVFSGMPIFDMSEHPASVALTSESICDSKILYLHSGGIDADCHDYCYWHSVKDPAYRFP